jgi:hypothetical protein
MTTGFFTSTTKQEPRVDRVIESIRLNERFTSIYFYPHSIGCNEVIEMADALKKNTLVVSVQLSGNIIGDNGATAFAEALKVNKTIKYLVLSVGKIGDTGIIAIAESLKVNTTLISIKLDANPFRENGALSIAAMLKVNTTLSEIECFSSFELCPEFRYLDRLVESLEGNTTITNINACCYGNRDAFESIQRILARNRTLYIKHRMCILYRLEIPEDLKRHICAYCDSDSYRLILL